MHKQTLKNLRDFLNHTTFEHNLGLYLSELDEKRFECLAAAIPVEGDICIADEKTSAPKQTTGLS